MRSWKAALAAPFLLLTCAAASPQTEIYDFAKATFDAATPLRISAIPPIVMHTHCADGSTFETVTLDLSRPELDVRRLRAGELTYVVAYDEDATRSRVCWGVVDPKDFPD